MKDEEMAEEYANNIDYTKTVKMFDYVPYHENCDVADMIAQAFLAGLKAGRPQWHDINDKEPSKEQLGKHLLIRMESVIGYTDYDYLVYKYAGESITDVVGVIAWCEIPTFDKESE